MDGGMTGQVPRFRKTYDRRHCISEATLRVFGWDDNDVDRLLGTPDGRMLQGGPGYGAERVLLASLSDDGLLDHLRADDRAHSWRDELLPDDADEGPFAPTGRYIRLEGFPWLVLCQGVDAVVGESLEIPTQQSGTHLRVVSSVYAQWGDFALVVVRKHPDGTETAPGNG